MEYNKSLNFPEWYKHNLIESEFIRYYDISGCYVLLPNSFAVWENIKNFLDAEFKKRNVSNVYFPMFVTKARLDKEKNHLEGFSPEVAWVTKYGDGSDNSEMKEELAIRPTSETIMYPVFKDLVESHHDLPVKYNQWCNVVRWEFKDATPFIRSREFLWNEGHTMYLTQQEADDEVIDIINLYKRAYEEELCVPVIRGKKTEKEKFPGGDYTYTIETIIPETGKSIQCATAHSLGQNFSKIFDISVQDSDRNKIHPYQNSWGFTTRSIGVMLMVHGDDKGFVVPPKVSSIQIVIIPVVFKKQATEVEEYAIKVRNLLSGYRTKLDMSKHNSGWKYNYWERRGVPFRLEVGPRDIRENKVIVCRRDTMTKTSVNIDTLLDYMVREIESMQSDMLTRAKTRLYDSIVEKENLDDIVADIENKKIVAMSICGIDCEEKIKELYQIKSLCVPYDEYKKYDTTSCVVCGGIAEPVLFGKSY